MKALEHMFDAIWAVKVRFFIAFLFVVTGSYGVLYALDFIPETPEEATNVAENNEPLENVAPNEPSFQANDATPNTIIIDKLDREVAVRNPDTRSVAELDKALLSGAVRHPDSADLLDEGTMFLFAHSSGLPNVINKNFQAFNGIQNLEWGDTIRVQSDDAEYTYRVDRVYQVKASQAEVVIERGVSKLTLSTCNSFGSKDDRNIVEATLVSKKAL